MKIVLITGGRSEMAISTSRILNAEGYSCILADIDYDEDFTVEADKVSSLDVTSEESWINLIYNIENTFGRLDSVINIAGLIHSGNGIQNPEMLSVEDWNKILNVNVTGVFLGFKHYLRLFKNTSGMKTVINLGSRSGMIGTASTVAYSASKAAVINLTQSLALFCAQQKYNIRVNCISPGPINTKPWKSLFDGVADGDGLKKKIEESIPLNFMGNPDDIGELVKFLISDKSKFINGQNIVLDGGLNLGTTQYDRLLECINRGEV
jgi:3(or 17)beta-hydroxysteroid dehydrogenase